MRKTWLCVVLVLFGPIGARGDEVIHEWQYNTQEKLKNIGFYQKNADEKFTRSISSEQKTPDGDNSLQLFMENAAPGANNWDKQINFTLNTSLSRNNRYKIEFWIKGDAKCQILLEAVKSHGPYAILGAFNDVRKTIDLTGKWQKVSMEFKPSRDWDELVSLPRMMFANYPKGGTFFVGPVRFTRVISIVKVAPGTRQQTPVAAEAANVIWMLGKPDGSSAEFLPYSNREFKYNREIAGLPGCDLLLHRFDYVCKNSANAAPKFPAGISCLHNGNYTAIREETISWDDPNGGFRVLEIRVLDSHVWDYLYKGRSRQSVDLDSMDIAKSALRIALPDGQVVCRYLPFDMGKYLKKNGPLVIKACFKASTGKNTIALLENSDRMTGRCYYFDYIKLFEVRTPFNNAPVLEISPERGFKCGTVYESGNPAGVAILTKVYNLDPRKSYRLNLRFIDYFDKELKNETKILDPQQDGTISLVSECSADAIGHIRAVASLDCDGKPLKLQYGTEQITTRLAGVRTIVEPDAEETEKSFLGLCGIPGYFLFDPKLNEYTLKDAKNAVERYRNYRRALQVHNERMHSLSWNFVEKEESVYNWDFRDWMIAGERNDNIRLQLAVYATPRWMIKKHYPERMKNLWHIISSCPPELDKWAEFCSLLAKRYKDDIADIEIWNEPSENSIFWYKANADDYFNLVKSAANAIRRVAPEINIVAETVWARQDDFRQRLYDLGIAEYIDYPADHYMTKERIKLTREFLRRHGCGKGLIDNESHCNFTGDGMGEIDDAKSRVAARNLLYRMVYANANGIRRIYNYLLLGGTWRGSGLVGPDGTPKFAFSAMKTLVNRTTGAEFFKSLDFGGNIEAYSYRYFNQKRIKANGSDNILFLFNTGQGGVPLTLYVGNPAIKLVDIMDNESIIQADNGLVRICLNQDPVMIVGADLSALSTQAARNIKNSSLQAEPGDNIILTMATDEDLTSVKVADIKLNLAPISEQKDFAVRLTSGKPKQIKVKLRNNLIDGTYAIESTMSVEGKGKAVNIPGNHEFVVSRIRPGGNYFPENSLDKSMRNWLPWGAVNLENRKDDSGKTILKMNISGTGAVRFKDRIDLIAGHEYYFSLNIRGAGIFRLMLKRYYVDGHVATDHNLVSQKLTDAWKKITANIFAEPGLKSIEFHLYQHKSNNWMELSDAYLTRIPDYIHSNRVLYSCTAHKTSTLTVDAKVEDWPEQWLAPVPEAGVRIEDFSGESDLSARFAIAWRDQTLYFLFVVRDDKMAESDKSSRMWSFDSIQLDFDPYNYVNKEPTETCQLTIGICNGKSAVYRHKIISTPDIAPSYRLGEAPAGIRANITRNGDVSVYRIAIPAIAISPTLHLVPGQNIAFSFLINDNDGKGRKGWLQWSDGIGTLQNSGLFGTLTLE